MGLSPKLFARVTRFQMALDAKRISPAHTWLGVAHEFGYFDEMHMIRDFKNLGGGSKSVIRADWGSQTVVPCIAHDSLRPLGALRSEQVSGKNCDRLSERRG
jgi:hypothetical protein